MSGHKSNERLLQQPMPAHAESLMLRIISKRTARIAHNFDRNFSLSKFQMFSICFSSTRRLPTERRRANLSLSFVCDKYAAPEALISSIIFSLRRSKSGTFGGAARKQ